MGFRLSIEGTLEILEYTDGADGSAYEELWSLEVDNDGAMFTFDLTAEGCLEVNVASSVDPLLTLCSEFVLETSEPTPGPTSADIIEESEAISTTDEGQDEDASSVLEALTSGNFN